MVRWVAAAAVGVIALSLLSVAHPRWPRPATGLYPIYHPAYPWFVDDSRPRLRSLDLEGSKLKDAWRIADPIDLSPEEVGLLPYFDGNRTLDEITSSVILEMADDPAREYRGHIQGLHLKLDRGFCLVNSRFQRELKRQVEEFERAESRPPIIPPARLPALEGPARPARGIVAPHIDYRRGASVYAKAYGSIKGRATRRVVILGTAHMPSAHYFTVTRKRFGQFETDGEFIDRLERAYPHPLHIDEFLHRSEHSIELQLPWIEAAVGRVPIVPILCGSLGPSYEAGRVEHPEIGAFVEALRGLIDAETLVVAASDLSHIGPGFGRGEDLTRGLLKQVEAEDRAILEAADPDACFLRLAATAPKRRICGGMPLYILHRILFPARVRMIDYRQCMDDMKCVTVAGMAFE